MNHTELEQLIERNTSIPLKDILDEDGDFSAFAVYVIEQEDVLTASDLTTIEQVMYECVGDRWS